MVYWKPSVCVTSIWHCFDLLWEWLAYQEKPIPDNCVAENIAPAKWTFDKFCEKLKDMAFSGDWIKKLPIFILKEPVSLVLLLFSPAFN